MLGIGSAPAISKKENLVSGIKTSGSDREDRGIEELKNLGIGGYLLCLYMSFIA